MLGAKTGDLVLECSNDTVHFIIVKVFRKGRGFGNRRCRWRDSSLHLLNHIEEFVHLLLLCCNKLSNRIFFCKVKVFFFCMGWRRRRARRGLNIARSFRCSSVNRRFCVNRGGNHRRRFHRTRFSTSPSRRCNAASATTSRADSTVESRHRR
jgi:hypothetical protein